MTSQEQAQRFVAWLVRSVYRDVFLDIFLYGKHPTPESERSPADPRRLDKEKAK